MRELEQETNVEVLREFSSILLKTVGRLESTVTELKREKLVLLGKEIPGETSEAWLTTELRDQLTRLQKKFFGFGRETLPGKPARPIGHKNQEVLTLTSRPQEKTEPAPQAGTARASALSSETESKAHDFLTPIW